MRSLTLAVIAAIAAGGLTACATMSDSMLPQDRVLDHTSRRLGVPADQITISNRMPALDGLSYIATVKGVRYACTIKLAYGTVNHIDCPRAAA